MKTCETCLYSDHCNLKCFQKEAWTLKEVKEMKHYCNSCKNKQSCMKYIGRKLTDFACEKYEEDWSDL